VPGPSRPRSAIIPSTTATVVPSSLLLLSLLSVSRDCHVQYELDLRWTSGAPFTRAEGAEMHTEPMGRSLIEQRIYHWLDETHGN
jgi:hypothetical protein